MAAAKQMMESSPPPLPKKSYYVAFEEEPTGPWSEDELLSMIKDGRLTPKTLVWQEGMKEWQEAGEVLAGLFRKVPPPLR